MKTEEIKTQLAGGGLVITNRQMGKTHALLSFVAEDGAEKWNIVTFNHDQAGFLRRYWSRLFGETKTPQISVRKVPEGWSRKVAVDEWFLCGAPSQFDVAVASVPFKVKVIE